MRRCNWRESARSVYALSAAMASVGSMDTSERRPNGEVQPRQNRVVSRVTLHNVRLYIGLVQERHGSIGRSRLVGLHYCLGGPESAQCVYCFPSSAPPEYQPRVQAARRSVKRFAPTAATPTGGAWTGVARGPSSLPHTAIPQIAQTAPARARAPQSPPVSPPAQC